MTGGVVGIGGYKSILGDRLGITKDDELVVGGRVLNTPYAALGAGVPYYCDPDNGDNNLSGRTPGTAVASLVTAFGLTTAEQNDLVVLIGDGNTSGTARLTGNLDWNKDATHLVGIGAPNRQSKRVRISHAASAPSTNTTMVTFSKDGCIFENFAMFEGMTEAASQIAFKITGLRNYFGNVSFEGLGASGSAGQANSVVVELTAASENRFVDCVFGLESMVRTAANATLEFASACKRNSFENCLFPMYATATSPLWITVASSGLGSAATYFKGCEFIETNLSGSSTPSVVALFNGVADGTLAFTNCYHNAAAWSATSVQVQVSAGEKTNNVYASIS